MLLIKTSAGTLRNVLLKAKHAVHGRPSNLREGDIILVSQTKGTLARGQMPIRWIMDYVRTYEDLRGESDRLWGQHWPLIIEAKNVRSIEPFDLDDIRATNKEYYKVQTFCAVKPEDEAAVLEWIGEESLVPRDERVSAAEELSDERRPDYDAIIARLDRKYAGTPKYKESVVCRLQRPSDLRQAILDRADFKCRLCGAEGFRKRGGGKYAEAHHMLELNKLAPNTLQSWNVLVVCPTCHRMLHHADVKTEFLGSGWRIHVNGKEHVIR
jgi:5-methylcytosine-specific restriction protein A